MKLKKFRVRKFRSIQDSGWVNTNQVNALLGENESGKTNLLLPLWKLNPSSGGEISLLADAPREEFNEVRETPDNDKPWFITAHFQLTEAEQKKIASIAECELSWVDEVIISRRFDGEYNVIFPNANPPRKCSKLAVLEPIHTFKNALDSLAPNKTDTKPRIEFIEILDALTEKITDGKDELGTQELQSIISKIDSFDMTKVSKTGGILELRRQYLTSLKNELNAISVESPTNNDGATEKAKELMPTFIYYSNYGNLDGQIYLPRVIEDLRKSNLPEKEAAKARTLKVLFEYVKLKPQEILELGQDLQPQQVNDKTIEAKAEQKKERAVLLNSAGTTFTKSFREWWRQGNYVFRFQADGDHFKIWVSDSLRTAPIELESRSSGLQWFFSFFLIFLNERHDTHQGSILLLDEPGVTLHPMAQKDLFAFFEGLSVDNQIIYTTHSPFLMDADKLDQVKAVYVDENGYSTVSDDLRARANRGTDSKQKAIFPVHSALGLTVSEVLFVGCKIVLVEGPSDQYYLNAIKNILIAMSKISPQREIVFVPAGGTRGIKTTSRILSSDENDYPSVLLDGDAAGRLAKKQLEDSLYQGRVENINLVTDFVDMPDAEIEDLIEKEFLTKTIDREFRGQDYFEDISDANKPIVPQIEEYCQNQSIDLEKGWKVDIARIVKQRMAKPTHSSEIDETTLEIWTKLFEQWIE